MEFDSTETSLLVGNGSNVKSYALDHSAEPNSILDDSNAFAMSPDGHWLAHFDALGDLRLLNLVTRQDSVVQAPLPNDVFYDTLVFNHQSSILLTSDSSGTMHVFKFDEKAVSQAQELNLGFRVVTQEFDSKGQIWSAGTEFTTRVGDAVNFRVAVTNSPAPDSNYSIVNDQTVTGCFYFETMSFSADASTLVVYGKSGEDWTDCIRPLSNGLRILTPPTPESVGGFLGSVPVFAVSADGNKLMTADFKGRIVLWDVASHAKATDFSGPIDPVIDVRTSKDSYAITSHFNTKVALWDLIKGDETGEVPALGDTAALGSNSDLAFFDQGGNLTLLDLQTSLRQQPGLHITESPTRMLIATLHHKLIWNEGSDNNPELKMWDLQQRGNSSVLCRSPSNPKLLDFATLALSRSGEYMAAVCVPDDPRFRDSAHAVLYLWNLSTLTRTEIGTGMPCKAIAFSDDDTYLAWADYRISTLNLRTRELSTWGNGTAETEYSALSFSADGQTLVAALSNYMASSAELQFWSNWRSNGRTARTTSVGLSPVTGLAAFGKNEVIASSFDGSSTIYDSQTAEPVVTLVSVPRVGGAAVTPEGLFDGSADAVSWIGWRKQGSTETTPADVFFEEFYYPGLLGEINRGSRPKPPLGRSIADLVNIPGFDSLRRLRLASFAKEDGKFGLCLDSRPTIDVLGYVGITYKGEPKSLTPADFHPISEGNCNYFAEFPGELEAYEVNARGLSDRVPKISDSQNAHLPTTSLEGATIYYQAVAFNDYQALDRLNFPFSDGEALGDFFRVEAFKPEKRGGPHVEIEPIITDGTSVKAIRQRLREIGGKSKAQDIVILFFSGHGAVPPGQEMFYFLPDTAAGNSPDLVVSDGMNSAMIADALRNINARRVLVIFDSCQSGATLDSLTKLASALLRAEQERNRTDNMPKEPRPGIALIAAATSFQEALEQKTLGYGFLTRALLDALRSDANSAYALTATVSAKMKPFTQQIGRKQDPEAILVGADFPLKSDMK